MLMKLVVVDAMLYVYIIIVVFLSGNRKNVLHQRKQ